MPGKDRCAEQRQINGAGKELEGESKRRRARRESEDSSRQDACCKPSRRDRAGSLGRTHARILAAIFHAEKEEPRRGDCRGSYALHRTHYHPDKLQLGA